MKTFGREATAVRYYRLMTSTEPWRYYASPIDPEEEHSCTRGKECLCRGLPISIREFWRQLHALWPPLEEARVEVQWMTPFEPWPLEDEWLPPHVITDPRRLLPPSRMPRYARPWTVDVALVLSDGTQIAYEDAAAIASFRSPMELVGDYAATRMIDGDARAYVALERARWAGASAEERAWMLREYLLLCDDADTPF